MIFKKKKTVFFAAAAAAVLVLVMLQSCSGTGRASASLFGNQEVSPLRDDGDADRACEIQNSFRKIYELYRDRVVYITTEQTVRVKGHPFYSDPLLRQFFGLRGDGSKVETKTGLGTGFVLSKDGYICTNFHVVDGMDRIFVEVQEKNYQAAVVGKDRQTDIALLKIEADNLLPVFLGDSDTVQVGDWAIAIGNPFGLARTFTVGVVSAVGRSDVDMAGSSHIQTDASINPGNSGGPLISIYGEVIGINRMIYSSSGGDMGIGFAVPVNTARTVLAQLRDHHAVKRGYIGINVLDISPKTAEDLGIEGKTGVLVGAVAPGSPADTGGLKVGDVILEIDGIPAAGVRETVNMAGQIPAGKKITLTVWRKRQKISIDVTVRERPVS